MTQGTKIQNLAKQLGIKQLAIVKHIGWTKAGFSRKVNSDQRFDPKTLSEIAAFLGVKPEFLKDESIEYTSGPIPEGAIATPPTPVQSPPPNLVELRLLMERQAADIARSENERMKMDIDALKESSRQLASLMSEISGNNRVTSETLLAVAEIVRDMKDDREGGHDPD